MEFDENTDLNTLKIMPQKAEQRKFEELERKIDNCHISNGGNKTTSVKDIPWMSLKNGCNISKNPLCKTKLTNIFPGKYKYVLKGNGNNSNIKICYTKDELFAIKSYIEEKGFNYEPNLSDSLKKSLMKTFQHNFSKNHFQQYQGGAEIFQDLEKLVKVYDKQDGLFQMYLTIEDYIVKGVGATIALAKKNTIAMGANVMRRKQADEELWLQPLLDLNLPLLERLKFVLDRRAYITLQQNGSRFMPTNCMLTTAERKFLDDIDTKIDNDSAGSNRLSLKINGHQLFGTGESKLAQRDNLIKDAFVFIQTLYKTNELTDDILQATLELNIE